MSACLRKPVQNVDLTSKYAYTLRNKCSAIARITIRSIELTINKIWNRWSMRSRACTRPKLVENYLGSMTVAGINDEISYYRSTVPSHVPKMLPHKGREATDV